MAQQQQQMAQQQQHVAALQQQNAQMAAEMHRMSVEMQQRSAMAMTYGYGLASALPPPPQPFPSWQQQQAIPPVGTGFNPYQGAHYPPSLPPPSPFGGLAVGIPQGMPSDASSWFGGGSGQAPRRGGSSWSRNSRRDRRPEKKADEKKEKTTEEKAGPEKKAPEKEKEKDVLAPEPSGVKKPGRYTVKNRRQRQRAREKKQKEMEEKAGRGEEGEDGDQMTGVEHHSQPALPTPGPPQILGSEQQVAEANTGAASESQTQAASLGVDSANTAGIAPSLPLRQAPDGVGIALATESQAREAAREADTSDGAVVSTNPQAHQSNDEAPEGNSEWNDAFGKDFLSDDVINYFE